jgi:hypothetical protein
VIVRRYCLVVIASIWLVMALAGIAAYGVALIPFCIWSVLVYVRGTREAIRRHRGER